MQVARVPPPHLALTPRPPSVPIYVFACIVTICVGFYADRRGNRALINMFMISLGIAGYIILATSRLPGLSYFAIYLAAAGIYSCIPNTIGAWRACRVGQPAKHTR